MSFMDNYVPEPSFITVEISDTDPLVNRFAFLAGEKCTVRICHGQWTTELRLTTDAVEQLAEGLTKWRESQ